VTLKIQVKKQTKQNTANKTTMVQVASYLSQEMRWATTMILSPHGTIG